MPDENSQFHVELYPYQIKGVEFLKARTKALLADSMGLGKSGQAITAHNESTNTDTKNSGLNNVVICPAVAQVNWARELTKWRSHTPFAIFSYEKATKAIDSGDLCSRIGTLILDEAHYLKNPHAKRTRAILGKNGPVHRAARVWALTGTPMPNHAGELWPILYCFGITKLDYNRFLKYFCHVDMFRITGSYYARPVVLGTNKAKIPELKTLLLPIMLRRRLEDVDMELPSIRYQQITVPAPRKIDPKYLTDLDMAKVNEQKKIVARILGSDPDPNTITRIQLDLLAQATPTLCRYNAIAKIDSVSDMVALELLENQYDKIVIFCSHTVVLKALQNKLKRHGVHVVHGSQTPKQKQMAIDGFQTHANIRILIANIKTAGTAINLTASSQVLMVEQEYTPSWNAQAVKRCHRIGQTRSVLVRIVSIENSIDDSIQRILQRKSEEIALTLDCKPVYS